MNFKEQPCLQVFWPQVLLPHPIPSSCSPLGSQGLVSLRDVFPDTPSNDPQEEIFAPLFFLRVCGVFLSCSSLSTSEGNKLCYVHAAKGRAQCRTQRLVENHRPQAGRWPARPDCFQQSMCLCSHAHLRKIFFTFYICLCLQTYATFF